MMTTKWGDRAFTVLVAALKRFEVEKTPVGVMANNILDDLKQSGRTRILLHDKVSIIGVDTLAIRPRFSIDKQGATLLNAVILDRTRPVYGNQPTSFRVEADEDQLEHLREDMVAERTGQLVLEFDPDDSPTT